MYQHLNISIIVAVGNDNVIGVVGNKLPWKMPSDLTFYKNMTWGSTVMMGKNTYQSMLRQDKLPLGRTYVVVSSSLKQVIQGVTICQTVESAFTYCQEQLLCKHVFVIGGGHLYRSVLPYVDNIYLTKIHGDFEGGDAFFPSLKKEEWDCISSSSFEMDEKNPYAYSFLQYTRK